jgi:hypothetical protein
MEAPGGRYKIVERGRRLVTIDLWTGEEVGVSAAVIPPPSSKQAMELPRAAAPLSSPAAITIVPAAQSPFERDAGTAGATPGPWGGAASPTARPQGRIMPRRGNLPFGHFMIQTDAAYDLNGPRSVEISVFGILWWMITHHFRVAFFIIIGAFLFGWLLLFTPLLLIKAVRHGVFGLFRPSLTKLFDDGDHATG